MKTVKINKNKLLEQLKKNMDEHKFLYEEAMIGWKTDVRMALKDALDKARTCKAFITDLELEEPPCHLDEYENIIEMIIWEEGENIILDRREFNQFILDKWDWQYNFLTTASSYSSSSSSSSSSSALITQKMSQL